ncbi:LapA family protein [Pseudofrancisella aestuarii]|uniref:LapA family protein n=1 Tax=Pseudofrancisella aestuarii TaxID=2670347 RepID=A0ABV9TEI6_9GAMM|nr:LapA family protein [Pseudofrancisella aestuarii]
MFNMITKLFWQLFFGATIIIIVILSILNTDKVDFDYIFGTVKDVPLIMLMTIAFVIGLVFGSFITKFIQITKTNGGAAKK